MTDHLDPSSKSDHTQPKRLEVDPPSQQRGQPGSGTKCPTCGWVNRVGIMVCENCGTNLISGEFTRIGTKNLANFRDDLHPEDTQVDALGGQQLDHGERAAISSAGTAVFEDTMMLRLEIEGAAAPILLYPKAQTSLGRRDPNTGTMPDIDLTNYAGYRLGVSRMHAVIKMKDKRLEIYDLGSSNGTSVNGVRLAPHQPHLLRDGDVIVLGKMSIKTIFQQAGDRR
jgi:hypothetical protein